ncbi:transcription factor LHW isoform X1 [Quercus suber]|uniref:transcription factor LHW isoform X1 n=1 Tax=Quercus suber TaxID=58331 RepID=UPI000CE1CE8C|nr:transcription factor LHW-like isoform X1 [Quercus suber]POF12375.1 transcription factor [Quercus suber]
MGSTALRQFLKSLCSNSHWKYAVFWKLMHHGQLILTWEDGYCDYPKPIEPVENISDDIYFKVVNEIWSSSCETNTCNDGSGGYPIGLAVNDLSCHHYPMGEGVVGEVAFTGSHSWILYENNLTCEFNYNLVPECPDEWLLQFAAGIKTILLVPVLPHGVLQLGSLEPVAEDLAIVAYVKDRFNTLHNVAGNIVPFISNRDIQAQTSSPSSMSGVLETIDEPSATSTSHLKAEDLEAFGHIRPKIRTVVPTSTVENAMQLSGTNLPGILNGTSKNKTGVTPNSVVGLSTPPHQSLNADHLEILESKLFELSCLDKLQAYSQCNNYTMGLFGESSCGINLFSTEFMTEQLFGETDANDTGYNNVSSFSSFPIESELHKALGATFQPQTNLCNPSLSVEDPYSKSSLICNIDLFNGTEPTWYAKGDDEDSLLEAVVASVPVCLDDNITNRSNSVRASVTLPRQHADSFQSQSQSEVSALVGDDSASRRHFKSSLVSRNRGAFNGSSASVSFNSIRSTLIDEVQQQKDSGCMQPRKGTKPSNVGKRRARAAENQRQRPRDRQMIQDRVKELRQLVPNSAKCSIDGLLDRAVKHMLHLRSVTKHAEKLRQLAHHEVANHNNWVSPETKNVSQNGTSWAFDFGTELQICPIVVEDLEFPGHMLIEMLCDEHGLFLEIAEVIRGAELTILKGTMELRSNKTWAHFIVEGPRGFHRMDVFWPLMHLWQRKRKPLSCRI